MFYKLKSNPVDFPSFSRRGGPGSGFVRAGILSRAGVVGQFLTYFTLMKNKKLFNRKYLKTIRSSLRNNSTSAEAVLWTYLKSASIDGRKFRRQHSIGKYIADFYCPSEKLIVELDGEPHGDYIQIEKDKIRDEFLKGLGLTVLRFENRLVFQDPEYILKEIRNAFKGEDKCS